jgi:hypothetical protein
MTNILLPKMDRRHIGALSVLKEKGLALTVCQKQFSVLGHMGNFTDALNFQLAKEPETHDHNNELAEYKTVTTI